MICRTGVLFWVVRYILLLVTHPFMDLLKDLKGIETIKLHRIQVSRKIDFAKYPVVIN